MQVLEPNQLPHTEDFFPAQPYPFHPGLSVISETDTREEYKYINLYQYENPRPFNPFNPSPPTSAPASDAEAPSRKAAPPRKKKKKDIIDLSDDVESDELSATSDSMTDFIPPVRVPLVVD